MEKFKGKKPSLMEKIKQESIESLQSLTTHGLPNFFRTKFNIIKFMWFLLTLVFTGLSFYFIIKTCLEYLEYNVSTEVRLINSKDLDFPVITLCNKNKFSTYESIDEIDSILEKFNTSLEKLDDSKKVDRNILIEIRTSLKYTDADQLFFNIEMNERIKLTKNISEIIITCKFGKKMCNSYDFEWFFNSKYGNCYRFNSNNTRKIQNIGEEYGLILELNLKQPDKIDKLGIEKGFYVSIDSKYSNPFYELDNIIDVPSGFETNVKIEQSIFEKYPKPYSDCEITNIDNTTQYDNEYFSSVLKSNYPYSRSICTTFCKHKLKSESSSCVNRSSSIEIPNLNYCNHSRGIDSMIFNESLESDLIKSCSKKCPLECEKFKFDYYVSSNKLSEVYVDLLKFYIENYFELMNATDIYNFTNYDIQNNVIILNINFRSLNYIRYKESPVMSPFELISYLGGILGLFLGMSLLSFVEFIEIALQSILIYFREKDRIQTF